MRQLSFRGFSKRYVAQLSMNGSTGIYSLVREATEQNPRLREPLLLYAVSAGNAHVLLRASNGTAIQKEYQKLLSEYDGKKLFKALEDGSPELPEAYHKVWRSYLAVAHQRDRDIRVKELLRQKALRLQNEAGISTYRISKGLHLNNANVNAWLKTGAAAKVSLKTARSIVEHLEACDQHSKL